MARVRTVLGHGWRHGWRTVAVATTFVASTVVGVGVHGNLPAVRRLAARITNDVLADLFEGKIVVEDVQSVAIAPRAHVKVGRVTVFDPQGHAVIRAKGITADIRLDRLLGSVLGGATPSVDIGKALIEDSEVVLDRNPDGTLPIAKAFHPKPTPKAAETTSPPTVLVNDEDVILHIGEASIGHAWVHGNIVPPHLDGDANGVRARLAIERDIFTLDLLAGQTTLRSPRAPRQVGDVQADATGHLSIPLATALIDAFVDLKGNVGGLPFTAHAAMKNDHDVVASIDVPRAEPAAIAKVFPMVQVTQPVELHARAEGALPVLGLHLDAKSAVSTVKADGEIDLREGHAFELDVKATKIDAAIVGGPKSELSATAHAEGHLDKAPWATFKANVLEGGTIAGEKVPAIVAEGRFEEGKLTSTFRANEPGIDASGKVVLDVAKNDAAFDVQARSNDLSKLERAPRVASGAASVRVIGNVDLETQTIRARATANGDALSSGPVAAGHATAVATMSGPVTAPVLEVLANAADVRLSSAGKAPLVYPKAVAQARITFVPSPRISNAAVTIGEPGSKDAVVATATSIDVAPGGVIVRGGKVTGLGAPLEADIDVSGPRWTIRAKADDIDLERAAKLTGISQLRMLPPDARASVDIDVSSDGDGARGHADIGLVASKGGASADAHLAFSGRHVSGHARGELAGLGFVEVPTAELDLDGPPSAATFARATGFVDVRGSIDLAQVGIPSDDVEQVNGSAIVEARIERYDRHALPAIRGTVATRGLDIQLAGRREGIRGIEAAAHVAWDGRTEDAEVAFMTWDTRGVLASGDAKARLPLASLTGGKQKPFLDALATASLSGIVDMPTRPIESLPSLVVPRGIAGRLGGRAELSGSLASPQLAIVAKVANLREKGRRTDREQRYEPIDGVVEAHWDGTNIVAVLSADERERSKREGRRQQRQQGPRGNRGARDPNRGSGRVRAMIVGHFTTQDALALRDGKEPHFTADAELEVEDLELSPIPLKSRMRGALTGRVTLRDLGNAPSITGKGHVDRFAVSGARVDALDVDLGARDGSLYASARATDGGQHVLDVTVASRALRWKGFVTKWDADELTRVDYRASGIRLALLRTFARDALADLDGRVDGSGSVMFDAKTQTFDGQLALSGGRLYVNALGEDVTDVNAVARFEPNGVFRIQDATGKVDQGEFRASATGRMNGLSFVGANATIVVPPERNGIPLSSEGVSFAEATGEVRLEARMSDDRKALLVTVDIPRAELELPRRATPNLQPLDADETIKTGIRLRNGQLDPISLEYRPRRARSTDPDPDEPPPEEITTKFTVVLGDDVYLEGNGLRIQLTGKTLVEIAEEVKVTGRIDLKRGTIAAHGRNFTVEEGRVTFPEGGDATNPTIIASAYWDAPDRTRIWVEFKGPLKTGKLTLRSEPAFSKNEIFSILLFGRPDPNMAVAGEKVDQGTQGVAVGAGFAAADLTRALAELDERLHVETDTLSGNRTRAKVGYRLARNLRVQVGAAAGKATYREPDSVFAFLDWQFLPKLSLVATQGNRGTSILDVLFQHRY